MDKIECESQISSVVWSTNPQYRELVSSHGRPHNGLQIWKYPSLEKVADIAPESSSRVLDLSLSPDGTTVLSASADEVLRFWRVFEPQPVVPKKTVEIPKALSSLCKAVNMR